jgi:hypothetical protein
LSIPNCLEYQLRDGDAAANLTHQPLYTFQKYIFFLRLMPISVTG